METRLVTSIDYVEQPLDYWPPIFKRVSMASLVFGALYAAAGAGELRTFWMLRHLSIPTTQISYWFALLGPIVNIINGAVVISGSLMVLRGGPYESLIRGLRFIAILLLFGMAGGLVGSSLSSSISSMVFVIAFAARGVTFPLLMILILLEHRKAHPTSPRARKPVVEQPLPLLRP